MAYIVHVNTGLLEVSMSKDIHIRVHDSAYEKLKMAAEGKQRSIPTFMEYTALSQLSGDSKRMDDITSLEELAKSLKAGIKDSRKINYRVVA